MSALVVFRISSAEWFHAGGGCGGFKDIVEEEVMAVKKEALNLCRVTACRKLSPSIDRQPMATKPTVIAPRARFL